MEAAFNRLTCAIASQVATLTDTAGETEARPSQLALAAGGIVVNLTANIGDFFETDAKYTVIIRKET